MKTTLKYNTIETFQRQPAWKKFLDTIVDGCNGLYDGTLTSVAESDTDLMSEYTLFDDKNNNPKKLGLYEYVKGRYILSTDEVRVATKTYYKKTIENVINPMYSVFDYINNNIKPSIQENISIKGLLHILSLYGCRVDRINIDTTMFHTFKSKKEVIDEDMVWGVDDNNNDNEVQAIVDNVGGNPIGVSDEGGDISGNGVKYEYIKDLYGYNQKHPIISTLKIKEILDYNKCKRKTLSNVDYDEYIPQYLFVREGYIEVDSNNNILDVYTEDIYSAKANYSGIQPYFNNVFYKQEITENNATTIRITTTRPTGSCDEITIKDLLRDYFTNNGVESKWIYGGNIPESAYILIDMSVDELIEVNRAIFNTISNQSYYVYLALYSGDTPQYSILEYKGSTTSNSGDTTPDALKYFIYEEKNALSEIGTSRRWVVMNEADTYFNTSLRFLKKQIFEDETSVKAQPLFLYLDDKISSCANFFSNEGGNGKISYDIEQYKTQRINETYTHNTNYNTYGTYRRDVRGISYGDYFYKWEQYDKNNGMFVQNVYTTLDFSSQNKKTRPDTNSLSYFFNGNGDVVFVDQTTDDYTNNERKEIDDFVYVNTHKKEYFETMYFNHFIKVYPIGGSGNNTYLKTDKLYCEGLELLEFGDIIPYVVSNEKVGISINDTDCAVFAKILCYNPHTHLITIDKEIVFEKVDNEAKPKYVVVAYQNASPFCRIKDLFLSAPNDTIKDVVKPILKNFVNQNGNLWINSGGRNLLQASDRVLTNNRTTDSRNTFNYMLHIVPSNNPSTITGNPIFVGSSNINNTGRMQFTYTLNDDTKGWSYLWFKHNGANVDISIYFKLYENIQKGDVVTISFDVDGYNPSVADGLIVKNFKLERGDVATQWSLAPEEDASKAYEQIV